MTWSEIISWLVLGSTLFLVVGFTLSSNGRSNLWRAQEQEEVESENRFPKKIEAKKAPGLFLADSEEEQKREEEEKEKYTTTPWI